jgi:uncharacterized protein (UPF0332 family)
LTSEGRERLPLEEIERAGEELAMAEQAITLGFHRNALARAYFAAFHAVRALLYADDLEPTSHRGVQHLFNLHFVRKGRYEPRVARLLAQLQRVREEADYGDAEIADAEGAREQLDAARALVERIVADLGNRGA